ncbi:oligopeptide ABC transporter ATP-binding protein OppD [Spiroplasma culicicola]|uniref:Oligopeptide ABC transporter ATP-binding protein n=1 Tax=Spiroplasma culicicola AES-1 TaxID=1276246 RepID=W6A7K2_9MOLU|nr:oligopeptide ABC transporter ATP-binding protein OppD [Spiroplasma culicicola]AHI53118.1 oligopeptide ABC transporter ATP-binding protein [Spiroplasma culicicola AES-1]
MNKENRVLSVRDLEVKFQVRSNILTAIRKVSFDVYDGEILAIVGESGSGKSVVTKTFTGMLEANGWISQGSIVYRPTQEAIEDPKAYFKSAVDLVNLQKPLISDDVVKFVSKRNNKVVKKLLNKIKEYKTYNPITLDESEDKGITEGLYTETIAKNIATNEQKLQDAKNKLAIWKEKIEFAGNNRVFKKIALLENEIKELEFVRTIIDSKEVRNQAIANVFEEINLINQDTAKVRPLSMSERMKVKKIIKHVETFIETKVAFDEETKLMIKQYFKKRYTLTRFESELKDLVNEIIENNSINEEHFNNILLDWKKIEHSSLVNKLRAAKEIRQLRGKTIATIFQDPMTSLNPLLTVGFQISEVLRKQLGMSKKEAKAEAIELLRKVGIPNPEKRYNDIPGRYSGGMRQRVVIAIALACRPKVLICDEPTTALDVTIQAQILKLIKDLQKEYNFSVIFITHDLGVVASISDRIAVMYAGQVIEIGTSKDIFEDAKHPYTWALLSSLPQLGTKGTDLYSIAGTPPSLFNGIEGDAFAPRNDYALELDYIHEPPMFKVSETHYAKTWLLDKRAPKVKRPEQLNNLKQIIQDSAKKTTKE